MIKYDTIPHGTNERVRNFSMNGTNDNESKSKTNQHKYIKM